jgi:hypothetical protein
VIGGNRIQNYCEDPLSDHQEFLRPCDSPIQFYPPEDRKKIRQRDSKTVLILALQGCTVPDMKKSAIEKSDCFQQFLAKVYNVGLAV